MSKDNNELPSKIAALHTNCITKEELAYWATYYMDYEDQATLIGNTKHQQGAHWVHCVCEAIINWIGKGKPVLDEPDTEKPHG